MELEQIIKEVPKVLLHDHLDGGLRPQTVVELAADAGYKKLPTTDAGELALWFHQGANKGNLVEFLKGFEQLDLRSVCLGPYRGSERGHVSPLD